MIYVENDGRIQQLTLTPLQAIGTQLKLWEATSGAPDPLQNALNGAPYLVNLPNNQAQIEDLQNQLETAQEQQAYFENHAEELQNQVSTLQNEAIDQQTAITELQFHVTYLEGQIAALQTQTANNCTLSGGNTTLNPHGISFWCKPKTSTAQTIFSYTGNHSFVLSTTGFRVNGVLVATVTLNGWDFWQILKNYANVYVYKNGSLVNQTYITSVANMGAYSLKSSPTVALSNISERLVSGVVSPPTRE